MKKEAESHFLKEIKKAASKLGLDIENSKKGIFCRYLTLPKDASLRLGVDLWLYDEDSNPHSLTIYFNLYGKSKELSDLLIEDKKIASLAKKNSIYLGEFHEDEDSDGISIASKTYSLESKDFIKLGEYVASKITSDWTEFYELGIDKITRHNNR